jgi:hypothetical protein
MGAAFLFYQTNREIDMAASATLNLRLHSGVPVVDVHGSWEPALTRALSELLGRLTDAGHFDIVVNVQRAALEGILALRSLSCSAQAIRSHCGHLDIVGTVEQIDVLIFDQMEKLFRLASSEEGAIGRIKRIPVLSRGVRVTTTMARTSQ